MHRQKFIIFTWWHLGTLEKKILKCVINKFYFTNLEFGFGSTGAGVEQWLVGTYSAKMYTGGCLLKELIYERCS